MSSSSHTRSNDTASATDPQLSDVLRQVVVAVSAVLAVAGLAVGSGALGGESTEQSAGGAFSAFATLIAPAGPAFSIWSVIYLGLIALAVWQLAPARRADPRQRATGWLVAVTMVTNAAWIFVVQAGMTNASVAIILALLTALIVVYVRLLQGGPSSMAERIVLDGTMGLYLGWVSIATAANIAAALADAQLAPAGTTATVSTIVLLIVVAGIGVAVGYVGRGRWPFSVALGWGLAWVSFARFSGPTLDTAVAIAAAVAAVVVLAVPLWARGAAPARSAD